MKQEYFGTTASALDHYFGNGVGMVRLWHISDTPGLAGSFDQKKKDFIQGLERAIQEDLPEFPPVTTQHLREMIALANSGNWADINTIKALYRRYYEIKRQPYNEAKLFG